MADNTSTPHVTGRQNSHQPLADTAATLAYIEARIAELYTVDKLDRQLDKSAILDRKTYLQLYTAIELYTTSAGEKGTAHNARHRGAHLLGEDIYKSLGLAIRGCCRDVLANVTKNDDAEAVLSAYVRYWTAYLTLSELSSNVFRYMERHWVKREMDETKSELEQKRRGVYPIAQLHMAIWREDVLGLTGPSEEVMWESGGKILDALTALQQTSDRHSESEQRLVQDTLVSFDKLGLALSGNSLVVL